MNNLSPNLSDFLPQFRLIGQSLKKRFFRKPNVADAIEQYESLCLELQRDEQKEFAGVCSLEEARCHETLQNYTAQSNCLQRGSKYLLEVHDDYKWFDIEDKDATFDKKMGTRPDGQLQLAVQALIQAMTPHNKLGNKGLVLLIKMKIGDILLKNNYIGESLKYFKGALEIGQDYFTFADQLVIVEQIIKCKVKLSELESASKMISEYLEKLRNVSHQTDLRELYSSFILKFEITRVCLLLLIGCDSTDMVNFIWPSESEPQQVVETKSDYEEFKAAEVPNSERNTIILYLKSLVLAVQHGSVKEIHFVHDHLSADLNETQHELFRMLIQFQS